MNKNKLLCSICIATYKRTQLLEKLLESLEKQELPADVKIEIIVVDNDVSKSAESVVNKAQKYLKHEVYYYEQPIKNISLARNTAIKNSNGSYILFIDDDETASSKWVHHLIKAVNEYKADGVFGPIIAEFNKDTPQWMRCNELFYNPVPETGVEARYTWTSNCIISATLLKDLDEPFDPEYGITGGGDPHLFERLKNKGANFIYSKEAFVNEYLPLNRTKISYIFFRNLKGGIAYTRRKIEFANKNHFRVRFIMAMKGTIQLLISTLGMALFCVNKLRRTKWMIKFSANLGRISAVFGFYFNHYKR